MQRPVAFLGFMSACFARGCCPDCIPLREQACAFSCNDLSKVFPQVQSLRLIRLLEELMTAYFG